MKRRVLLTANAAVGVIIICLSLLGLFQSNNVSDRQSAFLYLGFGALFCLVSYGLLIRSCLLVTLGSIPIIVVAAATSFILLFAPFAWGDSNLRTVYMLQAISLSFAGLQIVGLIDVFATHRNRERNKDA